MDDLIKKSKTMIGPGELLSAEEIQQKKAEKTIKNWLEIQKKVKVVQSLEDMMEEQHEEHKNKLEAKVKELYELKIKQRKIYNDIKFYKLNAEGNAPKERPLDYYIEEKNERILVLAEKMIKDFLFIIRENFDYIPRIVSLLNDNESRDKIESLAELFCNQFYDNILIPNPEQEELLICIYKLLELEINKTHSSNPEQFLKDSSFIGTFMTVFSKQHDLTEFLSDLLKKVMFEVENGNEGGFDISLYAIKRNIAREEKKKKEKENEKGKKEKKEEKKKEEKKEEKKKEEKKETTEEKEKRFKFIEDNFKDNIPKTTVTFKKKNEDKDDDNLINEIKDEYDLTFDNIVKKIKEENNKDLKSFYIHILNQITDDPKTFCKEKLIEVLENEAYKDNYVELITKFKDNILFIRKLVELFIQTLISKLTAIPYTVRCVCKIIDILISKKFPNLPKYLRHSFIGKFLFNKCIFPVLSLESKETLKKIIFTSAQRRCLNSVINIISAANQCSLFTHYEDVEKTVFNNYLLDIIPILNKFYDKLIDLRLPRQLNEYVSYAFEDVENKSFCFNNQKKETKPTKRKHITYDYFGQNPDELLHLQSICFTVDDAIFLKDLIDDNEKVFKDLPKFDNMKKAIKEIWNFEADIDAAREKNQRKDSKVFFIIYKLDAVPRLEEFLKRKKSKKNKSVLWKIKDCIKTVLKGLNLLDIKDYSDLNTAETNIEFFNAINSSIKDSEEEDEVPLNWYSGYIKNNLPKIEDQSYLENDLKKLYEELFIEEKELLDLRNQMSSEINAREGMNLQCAKKIVDKIKYDERILEQTKKFQKIETFIVKDHTQVCIQVNETIVEPKEQTKEKKSKDIIASNLKGLVIKAEKESTQYVQVVNANNCEHRSEKFMGKMEGKSDILIKTHVKKVNNFISKFSDPKSGVKKLELLLQFIKEDIESGEPKHQLYKAFDEYKNILGQDIINNEKELIESKDKEQQKYELEEILTRIEDHIMLKIYKYVFPKDRPPSLLKLDNDFYEKTYLYSWIPPDKLGIKIPIQKEEIEKAKQCLLDMENTAQTISDKLNCVKDVIDNINKAVQFNTGKKEKLSAEDHIPLLIFIIIQAHPQQFITNIHYMNCFFNDKRQDKVFLQNIVSASSSISDASAENLRIDPNEFNAKVEEARKEFEKNKNK